MPVQPTTQWADFLSCLICFNLFDEGQFRPISLGCGHTVCHACLKKLPQKNCPFDKVPITRDIADLPVNFALLQLVGVAIPEVQDELATDSHEGHCRFYVSAKKCIEELAVYLKPLQTTSPNGKWMGIMGVVYSRFC